MHRLLLSFLLALATMAASAQTAAPHDVLAAARSVNDYFMKLWPDPTVATFVKRERSSSLWTRAVYYEGLMALHAVDPQPRYIEYTDRWATFHRWTARGGVEATNADNQCCEQTYLDRHFLNDTVPVDATLRNLDFQMQTKRVDWWTWIDAIQMAMPIYSKAFRMTHDARFILYARDCYLWSRNECGGGLWNKRDGLWWRDKDFVPPYKEADGKPCYWSRGNGWVVVAYVRTISDIVATKAAHPEAYTPEVAAFHKTLESDYLAMMKALLKCQRKDGYWNVSLHSPVTYGGPETSGTACFLAGMSWGMSTGRLPVKQYAAPAGRAWKAIAAAIHPNGFIGYLQGTGKEPKDSQPVTYTSIPDFEDYGAGCVLIAATEYYKFLTRK